VNLYPTRATLHVALAGSAMMGVGIALHRAAPVGFGGAVLIAIALGRTLSLLSGTRLRQAGFEMVWGQVARVVAVARGEPLLLQVELRNRGSERVRATGLRAITSSFLHVEVSPREVELPPRTSVALELMVVGTRTGRWGLHGLALELRGMPLGGDGLYEVPLVFSNPFGVEVQPTPLAAMLRSPRGGRSGRITEAGRPARARGEGDELRELRDHVVGDPFKRIAWRASARRGKLVVREMERQERDLVWLVIDASVDGWAGVPGAAPLDRAVDEVAAVAVRHLHHGDRVGLVVYASRTRTWLPPAGGPAQAALITGALAGCSSMVDADRCELDELEVAHRVAEHMRPLAREQAMPSTVDLDQLARMAEALRARAPFEARLPEATTRRDKIFRHYLACFGIEAPPRSEGERPRAEAELARTLTRLHAVRPRPSIVAIWAPAPTLHGAVARSVRALRLHRTDVRWTVPEVEPSIGFGADATPVAASVDEAVRIRARAEQVRAATTLRALGVHLGTRLARATRVAPRLLSPSEDKESAPP
jgi:uncharacterized protein (DUF58 family)